MARFEPVYVGAERYALYLTKAEIHMVMRALNGQHDEKEAAQSLYRSLRIFYPLPEGEP